MIRFLPSERTLMILVGIVVFIVLVGGLILWLVTRSPSSTPVATNSGSYVFGLNCQKGVEDKLIAPATAQFESPWPTQGSDSEGYVMRSYVDSQNSLGANIRTSFICTSPPDSQNAEIQILN